MFEEIEPGLGHEKCVTVTRELTIATLQEGLPAVYGTPAMILLMEVTAAEAIQPLLPTGHISVGTEVHVRHLAATPLGERVTATVKVVGVAGNLVKFEVEARDERQLIGSGTHTRAIVDLERFARGLKRRQDMARG